MRVNVNVLARAVKQAFAGATGRLANPARVSDPDSLRGAVSGKTVLVTGANRDTLLIQNLRDIRRMGAFQIK